jgi:hypothetical protein
VLHPTFIHDGYNFFIFGLGTALFSVPLVRYSAQVNTDHPIIIGARFDTTANPFHINKGDSGELFVYLPEPANSYAEIPITLNNFLLINSKQQGFKDGDKVHYAINYKIRGREVIQHTRTCDGSIMLKKGDKELKSIGLLLTPQIGKEFPFSNTAPWFDCKLVPVYQ